MSYKGGRESPVSTRVGDRPCFNVQRTEKIANFVVLLLQTVCSVVLRLYVFSRTTNIRFDFFVFLRVSSHGNVDGVRRVARHCWWQSAHIHFQRLILQFQIVLSSTKQINRLISENRLSSVNGHSFCVHLTTDENVER